MNNKIYKKILLTSLYTFFLIGCISGNGGTSEEPFVEEVITYERVTSMPRGGYYLQPQEERTFELNTDIQDKNYLKLDITTDVNVFGTFNYSNLEDPNETGKETFYVPKGEEKQELKHFLDAYRPEYNNHSGCNTLGGAHAYYNIPALTKMAQGAFSKKLTTITIKNVSEEAGSVSIDGLFISDRQLPKEEVYLTRGDIKIGVDLMGGGTFTYLERLRYKTSKKTYNIDEVLTSDGDVFIGVDAIKYAEDGGTLGSEDHHVNLINYYDAGRQFQQSFYAAVGGSNDATAGENGYTRKMCYTGSLKGYYWPYNPVQGGDCHCNISQLVDYYIYKDTIYIKCKPLDWADNNYVTDSYMENWYKIENNCVYVTNRFVDYAGFTDMEKCKRSQLELPAAYVVQPFNTYVTYQGETPWINDQAGLIYNSNLGPWNVTADIVEKHPEDWFAWLNGDGFGVGVYIPDVSFYASGRSNVSVNFSYKGNQNAFTSPMGDSEKLRYNKQECTYAFQSCYTTNTCYTAPEIVTTMLDYLPFSYSYVLSVDYLPVIRNNFRNIYLKEEINNQTMYVWDKAIQEMSD